MPRCTATAFAAVMTVSAVCAGEPPARASDASMATRYQDAADRIIASVRGGHDGWLKLQELCDGIGHRLSGSPQLEQAIKWAVARLEGDGQENVRAEPVMVPRWVRGEEHCRLLAPRELDLPMLSLGGSVATPPEGIVADLLVVRDVGELEALGPDCAKDKIVLFNYPMPSENAERGAGYGAAVLYRTRGADFAARFGAAACLIRSVTTRSLFTPHTGAMRYQYPRQIPAAALTVEHAEMLHRLAQRGVPLRVELRITARDEGMVESANVVAELRGRERPDEYVVMGGHFDSWDVGQGANDDGGGCVAAMEALNVLRKLGLRPRRTIRVVLFTNEENGLNGARAYAETHAEELPRHVAAMETDSGIARLRAISVQNTDPDRQEAARQQMDDIVRLLEPLGAPAAAAGWSGADLSYLRPAGVLCMGVSVDMTHYFDVHHTNADTLDKIDRKDFDDHVAALAILSYVVADMPERLGGAPLPPTVGPAPGADGASATPTGRSGM